MPYIICVNQPGCLPEQDPYAVATIEEARGGAADEIARSAERYDDEPTSVEMGNVWDEARSGAAILPESGGTIGPLPDGYVIDVQRVTWNDLSILADTWPRPCDTAAQRETILDAYNQQ